MAAIVTADEVEAVLQENYNASISLNVAIRSATVFVARMVACAALKDFVHSTEELKLIGAWLAAHFYAQSDRTAVESWTGKARMKYDGQTAMGLQSTMYGQTAIAMDWSGCLQEIVNAAETGEGRKVASAHWLGKPPSEQIDYQDRD